MASEAVLLRGELVAAHITIFGQDNQIVVLEEQVASERAEKEKYKAGLPTFVMTCGMNDIFPCRAVVEMLRDPGWDMFNPGPPAPRDWSVFDSPAPSLPRPPGTEAGRRPAPAAAVA